MAEAVDRTEEQVVPEVQMGIDPETQVPIVLLILGDRYVVMDPDGAEEMADGIARTAAMTRDFAAEVAGLNEMEIAEKVAELQMRLAAEAN